jgi:hypothetical protein
MTDEAWKKLCAADPTFHDISLQSPETAGTSKAALVDEAMSGKESRMTMEPRVLTPALFSETLKTLDKIPGINLLSAPSVTTKSGQTAVVEMIQEFRHPTAYVPDKKSPTGYSPTDFKTTNVGVTLQVSPQLGSDGTIDLRMTPIITDFLGFRQGINGKQMLVRWDSKAKFKIPVFSTLETKCDVRLWDNQTLMLGGAKIQGLGAASLRLQPPIPAKGAPQIERRVELVFVTARVADLPPEIPYAAPVKGKVGFVTSPYAPDKGMIDVRGFSNGRHIKDPYTGRTLLVP